MHMNKEETFEETYEDTCGFVQDLDGGVLLFSKYYLIYSKYLMLDSMPNIRLIN